MTKAELQTKISSILVHAIAQIEKVIGEKRHGTGKSKQHARAARIRWAKARRAKHRRVRLRNKKRS